MAVAVKRNVGAPDFPKVALRFSHTNLPIGVLKHILLKHGLRLYHRQVTPNVFEMGLLKIEGWPWIESIIRDATGETPRWSSVRPIPSWDEEDDLITQGEF